MGARRQRPPLHWPVLPRSESWGLAGLLLRMGECGLGGEEAFVEGVGALLGCLSALLTLPVGATRRESR